MRPISGFDRPVLQYLFVLLAIVLIGVATWGGIAVRRSARALEELRADLLNARVERDQLEARAAREQSARESLSLQLARARTSAAAGRDGQTPTLTLTPVTSRGPLPPPPTVVPPDPSQSIALRLVLPRRTDKQLTSYQIAIRSWAGGQTIWSRSGTSAAVVEGRQMVQAYVTGDVFGVGAYEVLLTGTAADGAQKDVASYEVSVGGR